MRSRLSSAVFAAEQRALWPDPETDKTAAWGWFDVAAIVVLAWAVYWAHPGTWRRAPSHLAAFLRVCALWPTLRIVLRRPKYPWDRRALNLEAR